MLRWSYRAVLELENVIAVLEGRFLESVKWQDGVNDWKKEGQNQQRSMWYVFGRYIRA
jgi:hypothetical protein